jgi:nucleoside-diphosphate-sugar epimerase
MVGDLTDDKFAAEAGRDATVIYHCVNARYHEWEHFLPRLNRGVLRAAAVSNAPVVVLDNLYMYGAPRGPMTEASPTQPCSKKGALRTRLAAQLLDAHRRGEVRLTMARASDFFGPGVVNAVVFGERYFRRVLHGKAAEVIGDGEMLHSYSYGPDVAAAMITLGARSEALGEVWHVPTPPPESTRSLLLQMAAALGVAPRLTPLPDWVLRMLGWFSPIIAEVPEMTYQYKQPFILDDSRYRAAFGGSHTPVPEALAATAKWARATFA